MDYQNEKSYILQKTPLGVKEKTPKEETDSISLKDVPLKTRRKQAKKPLFLARYEWVKNIKNRLLLSGA